MKQRLVELLVCPTCGARLTLRADRASEAEIIEGVLACSGCAARYPVAGGVPRFVSSGRYAESFAFQWNTFRGVQIDSINGSHRSAEGFQTKTGLGRADVSGQLVLDAGVGAGRYADVVSRWGGEVVGVDITHAVDAAFANIGRRPGVHIVQADIFALPLGRESVDIAYSIGVLHHTPDPARAFRWLAERVRVGGVLAVYLYAALGLSRHFSDTWRRLTTRLPRRLMVYAAAAAVPLYHVYKLPVLGKLLQTAAPISMDADWRWRWLDTFDWYTPKFQFKYTYPTVWRWFDEAGFDSVRILDEPICMRGTRVGSRMGVETAERTRSGG